MNCEICREYLPEYQEGVLPKDTAEDVRTHLAACADCRREQQRDAALLSAARALPRTTPSPETILVVSSRIYASAPPPHRTEFGPVLDLNELAEFLRVGPEVLETYLEDIPHFELGGRLLFRRVAVENWIAAREQSCVSAEGAARRDAAHVPHGFTRRGRSFRFSAPVKQIRC
jgi:hypothetical protein